MEWLDKQLTIVYDLNEPFSTFIKYIEDIIETVKAVDYPYTTLQIVNKAFNTINKANMNLEGCREWKYKLDTDKT